MQSPEKNKEPLIKTIGRTIITAAVIAFILFLSRVLPLHGKSKIEVFGITWLAVFSVVFGGHWMELVFVNYLKFLLPANIGLLYFLRIFYWFLCSTPLYIAANSVINLFMPGFGYLGNWWAFGFLYIGIQLFMYLIMQVRMKKSFYNGVY